MTKFRYSGKDKAFGKRMGYADGGPVDDPNALQKGLLASFGGDNKALNRFYARTEAPPQNQKNQKPPPPPPDDSYDVE
jgi:hypothetical protein